MTSKINSYSHCRLRRQVGDSVEERNGYIPSQFAKVGNVVSLKDIDDVQTEGWVVESAGPPQEARIVEKNSRDHVRQRRASDIVFARIKEENRRACFR